MIDYKTSAHSIRNHVMFAATRSVPQASDNLAKTDHDLFMQFSAIWPGVYIGLRVYTLGLLITCTHACNLAGIVGL